MKTKERIDMSVALHSPGAPPGPRPVISEQPGLTEGPGADQILPTRVQQLCQAPGGAEMPHHPKRTLLRSQQAILCQRNYLQINCYF